MCQAAAKTAAELMTALEPELKNSLTVFGVPAATQTAIFNAYDAADKAIANWTPGTTSQVAIEAVEALQRVFDALPVPPEDQLIADAVSALIVTILGVLSGNTAAPAGTSQSAHEAMVIAETTAHVQKLVPGFKRSFFHSVDSQAKKAYNQACDKTGHPEAKVA